MSTQTRAGYSTQDQTPRSKREPGDGRANVFDIELLARRLVDVTGWLADQPDTAALPVGYFGAGGAARRLNSPWFLVPPTSSRNPVPSSGLPSWHATGSSTT